MGCDERVMLELLEQISGFERDLAGCMLSDQDRIIRMLDELRLYSAQLRQPPQVLIDRTADMIAASRLRVLTRAEGMPNPSFPADLPVSERCEDIVQAIRNHQVVVIAGETGSGKTTQIPKMCLSAGRGLTGMIACTQPRRVAALSISRRVSEELGTQWGREVGCKIRFSDDTSQSTYIKFMTDGMLLAEAQGDPNLTDYDTLIIDEAHERSLNIDFILGYLRLLIVKRPDLKVIITSATIDTDAFSKAFGGAPIIEVSGKVYPVEVIYQPIETDPESDLEYTYIEAAADAVGSILYDPVPGDVLVFMPGERDIRETRDYLEARFGGQLEILPLFGRMSAGDQQRIFSEGSRRRAIIATNIAETSITIPNIRFVIDSGMARVSRYSPRTRTKRLPIEGISQSSANQRRGRCGRVADGICIRLYSEEDFNDRPKYTQPELQRCNLAEVILRMKAFHLGEIETFPFLNPPQDNAIKNGYRLLQELGAIDDQQNLTELGERLARLPLDPMIGRMVIQAVDEKALKEVLVIAAGLSIQDPRERPIEMEKEADAAHKAYRDETSDFITLLNLWRALEEQSRSLKSQAQMRKHCRKNFISYIRYREWHDIHSQLKSTLKDLGGFELNAAEATPDAIHRSILTGLLMQTGNWVEKNWYRSPGNRKVMVFPGSVVFQSMSNRERKIARTGKSSVANDRNGQPLWILAGEFVETSQLYARNLARIQPEWIVELGRYLCQFSYHEPQWSAKSGRVLVKERISLKGLEILTRSIDYGRIHPEEATEMFIREALVAGDLLQHYPFIEHNQSVIEQVAAWQRRVRDLSFSNVDERLCDFYRQRFQGQTISSEHDLNRALKDWMAENPHYLNISLEDLTQGSNLALDSHHYPEALSCLGHRVRIDYAYAPGEEHDGVTIFLPAGLSDKVSQSVLDWLVPGYRQEKVAHLIRLLPKAHRKDLNPISDLAEKIASSLRPASPTLAEDLSNWLRTHHHIHIPTDAWLVDSLPEFLRVKVAIVDLKGKVHFKTRNIRDFQTHLQQQSASLQKEKVLQVIRQYEKYSIQRWDFGDLPEKIEVDSPGGPTVWLHPGLHLENAEVHIRVFRTMDDAMVASVPAWRHLAAMTLEKDMLWLEKDLFSLSGQALEVADWIPVQQLIQDATRFCLRVLFPAPECWPLLQSRFQARVSAARAQTPKLGKKVAQSLREIAIQRHQLLLLTSAHSDVRQEILSLLPTHLLRTMDSLDELHSLPRWLKARKIRWDRAPLNPAKDQAKWQKLAPWITLSHRWRSQSGTSQAAQSQARSFHAMVQEYYISIFAQELGTQFPISEEKLRKFVENACSLGFLKKS